jgi:uncharacterized protein (TIGR00251 family)
MLAYDGDDILLDCLIQPNAKKDEFVGEHDGALKIRIQAPPVEGAANQHLCRFLAKQFGVSKGRVRIEQGETGRRKRVRIQGPAKMPEILLAASRSHPL